MVKMYALMWVVGIVAAIAIYLAGLFTPMVAVVFGFLSFGAVFMGMISVLPASMSHSPDAHH